MARVRRDLVDDFKNITFETKGRLAYVTINRPDRRNAIDRTRAVSCGTLSGV
jgi:1,4-dihydroxy-2-naphthoyl-CoA synthase